MSENCQDVEKYLNIIRQILDNEASTKDEAFLVQHIESCSCCLKEYELEQQVRTLLKNKLEKKPVPPDLERTIRVKILQSSINAN